MAFEVAPLMPVPVGIVETPASATPHDDVEELASVLGAGRTVVRVDDRSPAP